MTNHAHRRAALANGLLAVLLVVVLAACSRAVSRSVVDAADTGPPPDEQPVVTIAAADESVTEGSPVRFTLTATPPPAAPLQVSLSWKQTGSWLDGTPPPTFTITTAGTAAVDTATNDDHVDEPDGEVSVTVNSGPGGYTVGDPNMATVAVTDNDPGARPRGPALRAPPVVTIAAADESVTEGSPVRFTLTATPAPAAPLQVNLSWEQTGSWLDGTPPATVTITTAGTAAVETATDDDHVDEPVGEVSVTVNSGPGYTVGDPNMATVAVTDNDPGARPRGPALRAPPVVTIAAADESVTEGSPVRFTLTATPPPAAPLQVNLSWEQTGSWLDGTPPATVTITPAGTAAVETATDDDHVDEPDGEVSVTVNSGPGYTVGDPNMATVAVIDNDGTMSVERIDPNPIPNPFPCYGQCSQGRLIKIRIRFNPPTTEQVGYRVTVKESIDYKLTGTVTYERHFDRTVAAGASTDEFKVWYTIRNPYGTSVTGYVRGRTYRFWTTNSAGYNNGRAKLVWVMWILG